MSCGAASIIKYLVEPRAVARLAIHMGFSFVCSVVDNLEITSSCWNQYGLIRDASNL
jgi:hypothetical protein